MRRLKPRSMSRGVLLPTVVGSVALVLAVVLCYVTIRDTTGAEPASATLAGGTAAPADRVVSEAGGFAVTVPTGLEAALEGGTVRLVSESRDLVIVVGPGAPGTLAQAERRTLTRLDREYPSVALLGRQAAEVKGNPTSTVYGQAVNDAGTRLRFAVVTVHSQRGNHAVAAYTAHDADPTTVLPRVNTVVNSFEVLPAGE